MSTNDDIEFEELDEAAPPSAPTGVQELATTEADAGVRLDRFLAAKLAGLSRSRLQALIREGAVSTDTGAVLEPGTKVKAGQVIRIDIPPPQPAEPAGEELPLDIAYEDKHLIVIDKPAGLVVHPAPGHAQGTLVNALIAHCGDELSGIGGVRRPGIVHRLDKDTSGLLVVAKSDAAHQGLSEQFAAHGSDGRLVRGYEALVWGTLPRRVGVVDANLARSQANRTRMAVVRGEQGRHAVTHYEVLETFADAEGKAVVSRVKLTLETGRTHQIRVHLAHLGNPVMGDDVYGSGFKTSVHRLSDAAAEALQKLARQALHAMELGFEHPITGKALHFTSSRPDDIERLHTALAQQNQPTKPTSRTRAKSKVSKR